MKTAELDAELKSLKETVAKLEKRVRPRKTLRLSRNYSGLRLLPRTLGGENLTALWSHRDDITLEINAGGQYKGWEAIKKAFNFGDHYTAYGGVKRLRRNTCTS